MTRTDRASAGLRWCWALAAAWLVTGLAGCAADFTPALHGLVPASGSARGGERTVVLGEGLDPADQVLFDGEPATAVSWHAPGALAVTTPRMIAGPVDVEIRRGSGDGALAEGAFTAHPLDLAFFEAAEHYLPDLTGIAVLDAVAQDLDQDGDPDLLLVAAGGGSRIWWNGGLGAFSDPAGDEDLPPPLDPGTLGSDPQAVTLIDLDGDAALDIHVCTGGGQMNRALRNDGGVWIDATREWLEPDGDRCVASVPVDLDGDGRMDLATAVDDGDGGTYLRIFRQADDGEERRLVIDPRLQWPVDVEGDPCGDAWIGEESADGGFTCAQDGALNGRGAGRLAYDFATAPSTHRFQVGARAGMDDPAHLELSLYGDGSGVGLGLRVVDANGGTFDTEMGPIAWTGWATLITVELTAWTPGGDSDTLVPPLQAVELRLDDGSGGGPRGELLLDDVIVEEHDGASWLLEGFERDEAGIVHPAPPASLDTLDADGDGSPDLLLGSAEGDPSLVLWLNHMPALADTGDASPEQRMPVAGAGAVPVPDGGVADAALLDADADGAPDIALAVTGGQDRLLLNDGGGHFLDASFAALPVDAADGRRIAAADLDLDGLDDLIIANTDTFDRLYRNDGDGHFHDLTAAMPRVDDPTLALLPADVDGDGDLDLLVVDGAGGRARLFVSAGPVGGE